MDQYPIYGYLVWLLHVELPSIATGESYSGDGVSVFSLLPLDMIFWKCLGPFWTCYSVFLFAKIFEIHGYKRKRDDLYEFL